MPRLTLRPLPPFFENKGWQSWGELCHYTFWATWCEEFAAWRAHDGSKAGLVALGFRPGMPPYRPSKQEEAA